MIDFNIKYYAEQYLYPMLRKARMLQFLKALLNPLDQLWTDFRDWRTKQIYDVNISGQTLSLQGHLNKLFDSQQQRIYIAHYNDTGLFIPLESEGYDAIPISLESEDAGVFIALQGEIQETIGVAFQVYVPADINSEAVINELYKYKLAGKSFELIIN